MRGGERWRRLRRWWRKRYLQGKVAPRREATATTRRTFLGLAVAALAGAALLGRRSVAAVRAWLPSRRNLVRPPTADVDDAVFQAKCIRCGLCSTVCENGCIRTFGLDEPRYGAMTPYLDLRRRSCTLCMRCTQVCPTGALTPVERDLRVVAREVDMGVAVVDPDLCLSYLGRVCGYCHDACPLPEKAIRLMPPAIPVVDTDGCVGCGRCVELCPQMPAAINVLPKRKFV